MGNVSYTWAFRTLAFLPLWLFVISSSKSVSPRYRTSPWCVSWSVLHILQTFPVVTPSGCHHFLHSSCWGPLDLLRLKWLDLVLVHCPHQPETPRLAILRDDDALVQLLGAAIAHIKDGCAPCHRPLDLFSAQVRIPESPVVEHVFCVALVRLTILLFGHLSQHRRSFVFDSALEDLRPAVQ